MSGILSKGNFLGAKRDATVRSERQAAGSWGVGLKPVGTPIDFAAGVVDVAA